MISLHLTSVKDYMAHLLLSETFDNFLFIEGQIVTFNTFTIDGFIQKAFFSEEESISEYSSWKNLRDYCLSLIKGKKTPLSFKFVFSLAPANIERLIEQNHLDFQMDQVQGLYLNIRYDGSKLQCVTGTSLKTFTMDKSLEQAWDKMVQKFFTQKEIAYEIEIS
ncbi:DUF5721 family protein [Faecalicatena contorta]|uniref:Uncharacterized protein n=1 Tax=Faecalicatena contorta TaxID=39482 RepID=A0A316A1U3_9FIRM|nr:hypothetical protein A8805_102303 [Faecalicatena contorta]SUQ13085.1 hypothetical protein SAMN05216529_102303 [Faecalicatena contorta]